MVTLAQYELLKAKRRAASVKAAGMVLTQSFADTPDGTAVTLKLGQDFAKATGNPIPPMTMVRSYTSIFQRQLDEARYSKILSGAPKLTEWLRVTENAAVARDDLENMSLWETVGNAGTRMVARAEEIAAASKFENETQQLQDRKRSFGDIYQDQSVNSSAPLVPGFAQPLVRVGDLLEAGHRWFNATFAELTGADNEGMAREALAGVAAARQKFADAPMSPGSRAFAEAAMAGDAKDFGSVAQNFATATLQNPLGLMSWALETLSDNAPALAAGLATTVATRNPIAGGAVAFGATYATEKGVTPGEFLAERGIDIGTPEGIQQALSDPVLLSEMAQRGHVRGLIIGTAEALGLGVITKSLASNLFVDVIAKAVTQAVISSTGEYAAQVASGQSADFNEVFAEGLIGIVEMPIDLGVAGQQFNVQKKKAEAVETRVGMIRTLAGLAVNSKVRERFPAKFQEFVNGALKDGPVENLYIPADKFAEYFQGAGLDLDEVLSGIDGVTRDDLDTALATGGDLKIPTASYATAIAGSEHDAFLMENTRFNPDDFTSVEAAEFNARAQDALQETYDLADQLRRDQDEMRSVETEIYDTMVSRLREAGRATDVATSEAMLYPAFYRTMAERSGVTVDEFMAKHPLPQVRAEVPAALRDTSALARTITEARARRTTGMDRGKSLLEFIAERGGIDDRGGELKAMGADTVRRKGKKTLRVAKRKGLTDMFSGAKVTGDQSSIDTMAHDAYEAGYLADDPAVVAYHAALTQGTEATDLIPAFLEAIRREVAGSPEYATAAATDPGLDSIEEYLASLGVALDDDVATIKAAVEKADREGGRRYGQGADPRSNPAFREWFGASKVVDAEGRPLVVYHGTSHTDIEAFLPKGGGDDSARVLAWYREKVKNNDRIGYMNFRSGSFFSPKPDYAGNYTNEGSGTMYPVYIKAENPIYYDMVTRKVTGTDPARSPDALILTENGEINEIAVIDPAQIKSVANRGTFDPNDPRILYQAAYHGTPHLFDKFSTDHIGTGEGAQAYGWGLYFAGKKEVAAWYRQQLTKNTVKLDGSVFGGAIRTSGGGVLAQDYALSMVQIYGGVDEALAALRIKSGSGSTPAQQRHTDAAKWIEDNRSRIQFEKQTGRLFEVDVPGDDELLAWDEPITEQQALPADAIESMISQYGGEMEKLRSAGGGLRPAVTGQMLYNALQKTLGSDRAASDALRAAGIPGHRYLDGGSRSAGDGSYNYVIYDDTRVSVRSYEQDMGIPSGGARGSIALHANGEAVISLFKTANLSTFLHESGHYFLSVMQDMAATDPAGSIATDYQVIKNWWHEHADDVAKDATRTTGVAVTGDDVRAAIDTGTSGNPATDAAIDTGMQEQFARATEQYLMDGKSPSIELRTAFEKFRAWLLSVYRRALGLNVEISDAMRGVFDRMLATDEEIQAARADASITSPLTAEQLGMTPEQHAAFLKLHTQAQDDASARLLAETMAPIRRAATDAYKAERARVREDVERNLKTQPVYRAIQELRFGRAFDGTETATPKLSREAIEKDYGAGYLPLLPGATKDGNGHRNAVFAHDGAHPDVVAEMYGLGTGKELLDRLANAPALADAVETETDQIMSERHPDPLLDGSIQQAALDAVHGDKRGQALAMELKALNEIAGLDRGLTFKDARESARRTLRTMRVKDAVRADRFLSAERKSGQEAMRLTATVTREGLWMDRARRRVQTQARAAVREADASLTALPVDAANATTGRFNEDAAALVEAKRKQLLNHMLYDEARKVADGVEKITARAARLSRPDAKQSKSRNIDYVKAARAIAAKFGLTRPDSQFDFAMWADQLKADDPILRNALADAIATYSQNAKPYKDLTVAELDAIKDAIESIMAIGKSARLLEIEGQAVEKELAISELVDQAEPRMKERAGISAAPTKGQKLAIDLLTSGAALVRVEAWARDMDDGVAGPFTKYIVRPVMDALGRYRADRKIRMRELLAIIDPRREELLGKAIAAPELGYTFQNKGELLHAILHTGNESNLEKLLLGRGWSGGLIGQQQRTTAAGKPSVDRQGNPLMTRGRVDTAKWDAMLARLVSEGVVTKADYDTAQQIWDLMEALKRPAQGAHRKMHGYYFKEVEPAAVETPFGSYRGGYVPAIADPYASADAGIRQAAAALEQQHSAGMFPTVGAGFTKSRVQQYRTPLALNLMLLPSHMDKVLRFTHLEPVIRQTGALVTNRQLAGVIGAVNRDAVDSIILPWLQRTARQSVETPGMTEPGSKLNKFSRFMRKRVGLHTMALNIVNAAQQLTGISSAAVLVKPGRLKSAMGRFAKQPGVMRQEAMDRSAFMRDRMDSSTRDTVSRIEEIIVQPTVQGEIGAFVDKHGYVLQQGFQNVVDVIAWHAALDQAVASGMTDADAIFEADSVIRRTQGSFNAEDVSLFESGTAFHRLFTMFYSYFNTQFNLLGGEAITTIRTMGWNGGPKLFSLYFFGLMIPGMVAEAIVQAARGELGDEDDDGYADDLVELFFGSQARFISGMVPVLGPLAIATINRFNNKFYDDRLSTSPVLSITEKALWAPFTAYDAAANDGSASKAVTDGLTLLGLIFGIPTGQLAKSAGYLVKIGEGDAQPENIGDVIKGLASGRDGTE